MNESIKKEKKYEVTSKGGSKKRETFGKDEKHKLRLKCLSELWCALGCRAPDTPRAFASTAERYIFRVFIKF